MTAYAALLRAVNLPSHNKVGMADLSALLERAAAQDLGLETEFFVRSASGWDNSVAAHPFPAEAKGRQACVVHPDGVGRSKLEAKLMERHLGTRRRLFGAVAAGLLALEPALSAPQPDAKPDLVARAQEFRSLVDRGEFDAARALMTPDPHRWWEKREGPGRPWTIGKDAQGPWAGWDDHFRSKKDVLEWTRGELSATAIVRETNDYYRLLDRPPVTNENVYLFDASGRIDGLVIRGVGDRPLGRTEAFVAWAKAHAPDEIEALMPGGEIDPSGDHPERFRKLLVRWREAAGLPPVR
jgi:hypothetical protein